MSEGRRIGCSRRKGSARCGPRDVGVDALRKRNLLEVSETDLLSSFFECWALFEAEGNNLRFKFVDETASEEGIMFLSAILHKWILLKGSLYEYGQVRHREATWSGFTVFCWMSKSPAVLALMGDRNVKFNLTEGSTCV